VYAQYCKNYEQAEKALDQEIASNPAFQKFISVLFPQNKNRGKADCHCLPM